MTAADRGRGTSKAALVRAWVDRHTRLLVLVTLLAVPGAALVLLVGGSQDPAFFGGGVPPAVPVIRTSDGSMMARTVASGLALVWLGATVALLDLLWHGGRRRLLGLLLAVPVAAGLAAIVGFGLHVSHGHRLRAGAETGLLIAAGTAFLLLWIGLAVAVATLGSRGRQTS
jgi:hypothetical protein